jgi:hypothetical protein
VWDDQSDRARADRFVDAKALASGGVRGAACPSWIVPAPDGLRCRLAGQRLVREVRFLDFRQALGCVERLPDEVDDFGRYPDICVLDGDQVRITGSPIRSMRVSASP